MFCVKNPGSRGQFSNISGLAGSSAKNELRNLQKQS